MKTRLSLLISTLPAVQSAAFACEMCSVEQPKFLLGLTHGPGPQGSLDYVIAAAAALIVFFALAWAIKCLMRPGEQNPTHIKRTILLHDSYGP